MRTASSAPSLLPLPAAAGVYVTTYLLVGALRQSPHVHPNYVTAAIVTWLFTLLSRTWFLRTSKQWTPLRRRHTTLAALLTGSIAALCAAHGLGAASDLGLLLGSLGPPLLWVLATAWIWRETDEEYGRRVIAAGSLAVACAECGYDLRGLKGTTRCPECGREYTLDELVARQFGRVGRTAALSPPSAGHDATVA